MNECHRQIKLSEQCYDDVTSTNICVMQHMNVFFMSELLKILSISATSISTCIYVCTAVIFASWNKTRYVYDDDDGDADVGDNNNVMCSSYQKLNFKRRFCS